MNEINLLGAEVLVVEDSATQALLLKDSLEQQGLKVVVAVNGEEAVLNMQQQSPTFVISDIEMPKMNGYEFCRKVKSDPRFNHIPVILLTNLFDPMDVIKGIECGADSFLIKPYNIKLLMATIKDVMINSKLSKNSSQADFEFSFKGNLHRAQVDRIQLMDLLLSTYSSAIQKNMELEEANQKLNLLQHEIMKTNQQLTQKQKYLDDDLRAAATIQTSLLPSNLLQLSNLDVAWHLFPCDQIGGDVFNTIAVDSDRVGFYMLDVSGHGVPSAMVTVSVSQYMQQNAINHSPQELLKALDREYPLERFDKFFTIFYMTINQQNGLFTYCNGGHPPPLLLHPDKAFELLENHGLVIGCNEGFPYKEEHKTLQNGDKIILYTDGVTEFESASGEFYGTARLCALVESLKHEHVDLILKAILQSLKEFSEGAHAADDISLMGIEYKKS